MIDYLQIINKYESLFGQDNALIKLKQQISNGENIIDRKNMNGHIVCSPFVFTEDFRKVLCIYHNQRQRRQQPGGHIDDKIDHPFIHGLRELLEETGLSIVRLHNRHINNNLCPTNIDIQNIKDRPDKNEGKHQHYDIQFICTATEQILGTEDDGVAKVERKDINTLDFEMERKVKIILQRLQS